MYRTLDLRGTISVGATALLEGGAQAVLLDRADPVVVTASARGLLWFSLRDGQVAQVDDSLHYSTILLPSQIAAAQEIAVDGGTMLLLTASGAAGATGYRLDDGFGSRRSLGGVEPGAGALSAAVQLDGGVVLMAHAGGAGIASYRALPSGEMALLDRSPDITGVYDEGIVAIAPVRPGGQDMVVTLSQAADGLATWLVDTGTGQLTPRGTMGAEKGFGLMDVPVALETVRLAGETYAIAASRAAAGETAALSVLRIDASGALVPVDHVLDTLNTRFGQVQSLFLTKLDGAVLIVAGGGDDGLSLFTLLPGGRLVHLDTLIDGLETALENVSDIAGTRVGDRLQLLVTSQADARVTQVEVALGQAGMVAVSGDGGAGRDILQAGPGGDTLRGRGGDDILADGAGQDRLTGGGGADLFVLQGDGQSDWVTDFDPAQDRIDLTGVPGLYDPGLITFRETDAGARLVWRGEAFVFRSAGGGPIAEAALRGAIVAGPDRPPLVTSRDLLGTDAAEALTGFWGRDFLTGLGGADTLTGGDGDDKLDGGTGADDLDGGDGSDTIHGGKGPDLARMGAGADLFEDVGQTGKAGRDTVSGGAGNDVILARGGNDLLRGEGGGDRIEGGGGTDRIFGGPGADTLVAGPGADRVRGGSGRDRVWLGPGHDLFEDDADAGPQDHDTVTGGAGRDVVRGAGGDDLFRGQDGADRLTGGDGADTLEGGAGKDTLAGNRGADSIDGGGGNDLVQAGLGRDRVALGPGDDRFEDVAEAGRAGSDTVSGGGGADSLLGAGGGDLLRGGGGADLLRGGAGGDTLMGGGQGDRLTGDGGNDSLYGGGGDDVVLGGSGRDRVYLEAGDDLFEDHVQAGRAGSDTVFGGAGDDWLAGKGGPDVLKGGAGRDTIEGGDGDDRLLGGEGTDDLRGGGGADVAFGGLGRDRVTLSAGADRFRDERQTGEAGADTVSGGAGRDTIEARGGADLLTGGPGADRFEFRGRIEADTVTDFEPGRDVLALDRALWGGGSGAWAVVQDHARVTERGVLFSFGDGDRILLEGLDTRAGLHHDLDLI